MIAKQRAVSAVNSIGASGRGKVLQILKTKGPQTAARVAKRLDITAMAVRQHLTVLASEELVDYTDDRRKIGRPARVWRLTLRGDAQFADGHAELAVGLLQNLERIFGETALVRLTEERTRLLAQTYGARMLDPRAPLAERVAVLSRLRREEGYMAESHRNRDGTVDLIENHCSIATAARTCPELCAAELELFRAVLGNEVDVKRTGHILSGDRSCSYCITQRAKRQGRAGV